MGKTYLITGANRGIGCGMFEHYAAQPNNTVIAAVRDVNGAQSLHNVPKGANTTVLITKIDSSSKTDAFEAATDIQTQNVTHLDVIVSAAGMVKMGSVEDISLEDYEEGLMVNGISVMLLYKAMLPLLRKAARPARFAFISAIGGSLTEMERYPYPNISYASSKAVANSLVRKMGLENDWLITLCIHPGIVQTEMGNMAAQAFGLEEAPVTLKECSTKTANIVNNATKKDHSGKFFNETIDQFIPW
ncbi:Uu.00g032970.m01.CDS01 [Anthostomella pinea]|uniref:Uu.00g032970.m01.CDS01 n=1 Tax=Anthostomella pinea TaxID=933095 RepID=A0AAI8YAT8_9PEZI|nr:Uu.00g032970.m01.CDS01 [Anthostomella pinea]